MHNLKCRSQRSSVKQNNLTDPPIFRELIFVKILLHGCNGKLGQAVSEIIEKTQEQGQDLEITCGVDRHLKEQFKPYPIYSRLEKVPKDLQVDMMIDFSHHSALPNLLRFCSARCVPAVICTTGFFTFGPLLHDNSSFYLLYSEGLTPVYFLNILLKYFGSLYPTFLLTS